MRSEIRFGEADIPSPLTNAFVATRLQSFPAVPLKELSAVEQERKPKDASFGEMRQADSGRGTTIGMVQQVSDLCLSMFILEPPKLKQNTSCTPHLYHIKSSKRTTKFKIHKPPAKRHNRNDFQKLVRQAKSKKIMKSPQLSPLGVRYKTNCFLSLTRIKNI